MHTGEILFLTVVIITFAAFSLTLLLSVMTYERHKSARAAAMRASTTAQRTQAIERLAGAQATIRELAAQAGVSDAVLRGMVGAGLLEVLGLPLADAGFKAAHHALGRLVHPDR